MKRNDEIVDEVRRAREAYAVQFSYDLKRMLEDLKKKEEENPALSATLEALQTAWMTAFVRVRDIEVEVRRPVGAPPSSLRTGR